MCRRQWEHCNEDECVGFGEQVGEQFASTTTRRWDEENGDEAWDEERMGLATLVGYVACVGMREGWIAGCMLWLTMEGSALDRKVIERTCEGVHLCTLCV